MPNDTLHIHRWNGDLMFDPPTTAGFVFSYLGPRMVRLPTPRIVARYVATGEITIAGAGQRMRLTKGEIAIGPEGMMAESRIRPGGHCLGVSFYLPRYQRWAPNDVPFVKLDAEASEFTRSLRDIGDKSADYLRYAPSQLLSRAEGLLSEFHELLVRTQVELDLIAAQKDKTRVTLFSRIQSARTMLRSDVTGVNSIDDVAQSIGLSKFHFCRTFKVLTGQSPIDYRDTVRFELARNAILGGASVSSVAAKLGYANQFSFSNAFKRHFGSAPSHYKGRSEL